MRAACEHSASVAAMRFVLTRYDAAAFFCSAVTVPSIPWTSSTVTIT